MIRFVIILGFGVAALSAWAGPSAREFPESPDLEVKLEPIVKEGTPGELLMEDAVVPPRRGEAKKASPSGSIQKSINEELPLPLSGTGEPGAVSQIRGLGRSAEATDTQTLGIPLNPPQGGGFDLSIFPQFIWAGYEFRAGPALGTYDPRGSAGSLVLVPWSASVLKTDSRGMILQGSVLASSARLYQLAAAGSDGKNFALVAGQSAGDAKGPSLAASGRWKLFSVHLLATDLDVSTPGPGRISPEAHQRTTRVIPVVQMDLPWGESGLLKSSLYYDWGTLRYDDPSISSSPLSQDRVGQVGFENALLWGAWKAGAGIRHINYTTLDQPALSETVAHLSLSRVFEPGNWIIEPVVRGVGVSRYGILPEASVGARYEFGSGAGFARAGMSRQFPSLVNRYYSYPGFPGYPAFVGNPELSPERDWTLTVGGDWKSKSLDASLQLYGQYADDAQVRTSLNAQTDAVINRGSAQIVSLLPSLTARPAGWMELGLSASFNASKISELESGFPGLPGMVGLMSATVYEPGLRRWQGRMTFRTASAAVADTLGNRLPPYQELGVEASIQLYRAWSVTGRLENVLDSRIELVRGYPSLGRTFALFLRGTLLPI